MECTDVRGLREGRGGGHRGRGVWVPVESLGVLLGCERILSGWVGALGVAGEGWGEVG